MATGCTCLNNISTPTTGAPGHMIFCWGEKPRGPICIEYWHANPGYCNPMSCSNSACVKKGCANARKIYCERHGRYCATLGKTICYNDTCPPPSGGGGGTTNPPPGATCANDDYICQVSDLITKNWQIAILATGGLILFMVLGGRR